MGSMKAILDAIPEATRPGPPCTVCALTARLPEDEAQLFVELLSNPAVQYTHIADGLNQQGFGSFESRTLARHARGQCWEMRSAGVRLR
jgi:hypothetical protein